MRTLLVVLVLLISVCTALADYLKRKDAESPNDMAALWRLRGLAEIETLITWLFDPDRGNQLSDESPDIEMREPRTLNARFLKEISSDAGSNTNELVRRIVSHPSFHLLNRPALTEMRWMMINREQGPKVPEWQLGEPRGYDPEIARRMAQWRNELRARFALPLEEVPELPTRWQTIRGTRKRFFVQEGDVRNLDGSTDSLLLDRLDEDQERSVQVWSLFTGEEKFFLPMPENCNRTGWSVPTALSGLIILGQTYGSGVAVADLNRRTVRMVKLKVPLEEELIRDCVLDRGGIHLLTQLADKLALFRVADGTALWKRDTGFSEGEFLRFIDEGRKVAIAPYRDSIFVLDTRTGADLARLDGHSSALGAMLTSADGRRLVTLGFDGRINVWDTRELKLIRTVFTFAPTQIRTAALSSDGSRFACAWDAGDSVLLYNLDTAALLGELRAHPYGWFNEMALSADGDKLAARNGHESLWINVWDLTPLTKR